MREFDRRNVLCVLASVGGVTAMNDPRPAQAHGGFRVPDEAGPHQRTFMQWPVSRNVHRDASFLAALQAAVARIANAIAAFEQVVMLIARPHQQAARRRLTDKVEFWDVATEDLWCRDSGPLFAVDAAGRLAIVQLNFNGWGNKQVHVEDGRIARRIAERLGLTVIESGLVGEAGGVETDGHGTLIAHESCWVNANRNGMARTEIERRLLAAYGAQTIVWAPGIKGADITDYHIDALARFAAPGRIVIQMGDAIDTADKWSRAAFATREVLSGAKDAAGRGFELTRLPEPRRPRVRARDFVASYVNYYVCNRAVVMAEFGDRDTDLEAQRILARLHPGREIVAIDVDAIGEAGGGIHCATQQMPLPRI